MTADFSKPTVGSLYTAQPGEIRDNVDAVAKQDYTGASNIPEGSVQLNKEDNVIEIRSDVGTWKNTFFLAPEFLEKNGVGTTQSGAASLAGTQNSDEGAYNSFCLLINSASNYAYKLPAMSSRGGSGTSLIRCINLHASIDASIFPATDEAIGSLGANNAYTLPFGGGCITFIGVAGGNWIPFS